jgi:TetR/AcrR family transcriptional repressor of mexJK operon
MNDSVDLDRRERRAERRRTEIVAVAREMFLASPYSQVSVEAIAAAAELSKVTVYSYFESKLDIYCAILVADAQLLVDAFREAYDPARDLRSNLKRLARAYATFLESHAEYFQRFSWYYLPGREQRLPVQAGALIGEKFSEAQSIVEQCLAHAAAAGEIPKRDFKALAGAIYAQWLGLAYLRIANSPESGRSVIDHKRIADQAQELLVRGLAVPA